jgi:hypothetical protein
MAAAAAPLALFALLVKLCEERTQNEWRYGEFFCYLKFSQSSCYIPFGGNNPSKAKILKISEKGWFSLSMGL